jgi:hypothetical protein
MKLKYQIVPDLCFMAFYQWVLGALSLGVTQLGYEADHSPPSSAKVKNV